MQNIMVREIGIQTKRERERERDVHVYYTVGLWLHHVREGEDWGVLKRTVGNLS